MAVDSVLFLLGLNVGGSDVLPLFLDFENGVYEADGTSYALIAFPGYSYTRSGTKSELNGMSSPVAFAANVPGIVPDIGYWSRVSLTNLLLRSQEFNAWAPENAGTTANAAVAPDGAMTADKLMETTSASPHDLYQVIAYTAATTQTYSVFAKQVELRYLHLHFSSGSSDFVAATFDLQAGTVTKSAAAGTGILSGAYVVDSGGGWYRCVLIGSTTDVGLYTFCSLSDAPTPVYAGFGYVIYTGANTTNGLYVWQGQMITGVFPDGGPLIATAGAAATIGADALSVSLANGDYTVVYMFADNTTDTVPTTIVSGSYEVLTAYTKAIKLITAELS